MADAASATPSLVGGEHPLWLRQFDRALDFPAATPVNLFMVCSTPRSGSHYFCHTLHRTRSLGYPLEYLNPANFRHWKAQLQESDDRKAFARIKSIRTSQNGVFGVKVHYAHLPRLHAVDERACMYKAIQLIRRDKISQAISFARASQTKSWISEMSAIKEEVYDWNVVYDKLLSIMVDEAKWEAYFLATRLKPLVIFYEDFLEDAYSSILASLKHLGVATTQIRGDPRSFLPSRQSDKLSPSYS